MVRSKKSIVLNAMLNTKNPHQNASLSIMGCPVINSFSLSRNAVTVWFSWSRCETEFGVGDTCQESAPGKGKEEKQEWTERESKLQCGFNKALASLGEWWGGGVALEWQRPVTGALGHAEMAGSCLLYSVTWPGDSCPGNARPGVRWVFSCCQTEVSTDHTLHSQSDLSWKGDLGNSSPGLSESTICTFEVYFPCMFQGWLLRNCSGPLFLRDNLGEGSCRGSGWGKEL